MYQRWGPSNICIFAPLFIKKIINECFDENTCFIRKNDLLSIYSAKRQGLDQDNKENYRPVSNLTFFQGNKLGHA